MTAKYAKYAKAVTDGHSLVDFAHFGIYNFRLLFSAVDLDLVAAHRRFRFGRPSVGMKNCTFALETLVPYPCRQMPKILLVEDNEMNRDMLSRRLERRGFQIAMALDGAQSVAMAQSEKPDLILMDMSLPVMDGWEATRALKAAAATATIPIIGLTAHAMAGDREKCLEAGCDDFDTKPIELPRLLEKIAIQLQKQSSP